SGRVFTFDTRDEPTWMPTYGAAADWQNCAATGWTDWRPPLRHVPRPLMVSVSGRAAERPKREFVNDAHVSVRSEKQPSWEWLWYSSFGSAPSLLTRTR